MGRYRRTVSFPNPPAHRPSPAAKSYHVRSASLPCVRAHPLIPQLRDELNDLRSWASTCPRTSWASVCDGLGRLKRILDSLDDVLQLPQTQDSLSSHSALVENLLEDFLRFVDVYGIFQTSALALKQELSGAQVAIRRKDSPKLGLHVKAQKKIGNEIGKLISTVGSVSDHPIPDDSENLRQVISDVHRVTASVTAGILGSVSESFGSGRRPIWAGLGLGKRGRKDLEGVIGELEGLISSMRRKGFLIEEGSRMEVLKRVQEMEDSVGEMERESERVFRSLISTRVSLLNILTHA